MQNMWTCYLMKMWICDSFLILYSIIMINVHVGSFIDSNSFSVASFLIFIMLSWCLRCNINITKINFTPIYSRVCSHAVVEFDHKLVSTSCRIVFKFRFWSFVAVNSSYFIFVSPPFSNSWEWIFQQHEERCSPAP